MPDQIPWPGRGDIYVMPKRTFQWTLGFWFAFATINGFWGGVAFTIIAHPLGWIAW